ncbi:MAG: hypothetical protein KDJ69_04550 [Nitratireductor sp.]|nr:hypothetical protein [Nitratireductor sp.]
MAEKKIGENKYRVDQLPATEAHKLMLRLVKMAGPLFPGLAEMAAGGQLAGAVKAIRTKGAEQKEGDNVSDDEMLSLFKAFQGFVEQLDVDVAHNLLVELCEKAEIAEQSGWVEVTFDHHIKSILDAYKLAFFVIQVQFRDFFPADRRKT